VYYVPFVLGVNGQNGKVLQYHTIGSAITWERRFIESNSVNTLPWFSFGTREKSRVTKKSHEINILPICWDTPIGAIALNFGMWG